MASQRSDILSLYVATESAYGTDPDEDGSSYLPIPAFNVSAIADGQPPEATDYADGSNWPSEPTPGQGSAEITFDTDAGGLLTSPSDPASVTLDWLDSLLLHLLGARVNLTRVALGGNDAIGQTVLTMASGTSRVAGDPVCLYDSGQARAQWARVASVAGADWTVSTPLAYALTSATSFSRGVRAYREVLGGGATLAFAHAKGLAASQDRRTLLGMECTKCVLTINNNKRAVISWGFKGDAQVFGGKASLPSPLLAPAFTPLRGALSPVHVNGVSLGHLSQVVIDLSPTPIEIASVHGTSNGRGAAEMGKLMPKVTLNPVHDEDFYEDVRAATNGQQTCIQIGAGNGDGDPLNSMAIFIDNLVSMKAAPEASDGGLLRTKLELMAAHPGLATGASFVQVCRA